jgi:hypothetical protein
LVYAFRERWAFKGFFWSNSPPKKLKRLAKKAVARVPISWLSVFDPLYPMWRMDRQSIPTPQHPAASKLPDCLPRLVALVLIPPFG